MKIYGKATSGTLEGKDILIQLGKTATTSQVFINKEPLRDVKRVEIVCDTSTNQTEIIIHKIFDD